MINEGTAWAIMMAPLGAFVLIAFVIRPFFNRYSRVSGYVAIAAIALSFGLSLLALQTVIQEEGIVGWESHSWLNVGNLDIGFGIIMDPLTAVMVVIVSGVSLLVQIYSQGYMRGDPGYSRYFAFMALFTGSMLGLVLSRNILQLYVFWELVGMCSYLLIGFWYHRPAAAIAAKKAFLVTRLGDLGLLLAILYLFFHQNLFEASGLNPLEIPDILSGAGIALLGAGTITWLALGVLIAAVGKSGQFPLHTWLPDAMEGPTPVSSLIHAATMVVAGVFLIARMFPFFEASAAAMNTVAIVGGFTAVFAATMGLVMNDIKRVLAYSTISQLGYMMLALGVGAYGAAIFHLLTHALFKCLLFLGSGSVNHATGTFDMRYMGGLWRTMPWTYATFLIAGLSLAGIFPLAGFWSKDEILLEALRGESAASGSLSLVLFALAALGVFLTSFYIFRVVFMTFHGEFRGGADADPNPAESGHHVHLAESPLVMVAPMVVLGGATVVGGFLLNPVSSPWGLGFIPAHWLSEFLGTHAPSVDVGVAGGSSLLAVLGIGLAYIMYARRLPQLDRLARFVRPVHVLLTRKYYVDEFYEGILVYKLWYRGWCNALDWIDRNVVDAFMDGLGWQGRNWGKGIARVQNGQIQFYGAVFSGGVLFILVAFLMSG
jgi:NADH-quinone oxidoreductase subunit L